jgi:DNA-binding transcriptional regulator YiaG
VRSASGVFRRLPVEEARRMDLSRLEPVQVAAAAPYPFSNRLKSLRQRLFGKQAGLAVGVGCTEAAVSYWETGRRLPTRPMLGRIIETLKDNGGDDAELDELLGQWMFEMVGRESA